MQNLTFRSCVAKDKLKFAILSDQSKAVNTFDTAYKNAYKTGETLADWSSAFTAESKDVEALLPESIAISDDFKKNFKSTLDDLIQGIDILFLDYNFGIEGNRTSDIGILDSYKSTDFVIFSHDNILHNDPYNQPYMVSYNVPRYDGDENNSEQHRIYCKTDPYAFQTAISAIISQRNRQNLTGGHINKDLTPYVKAKPIDESEAVKVLNEFSDKISAEIKKNKKD